MSCLGAMKGWARAVVRCGGKFMDVRVQLGCDTRAATFELN